MANSISDLISSGSAWDCQRGPKKLTADAIEAIAIDVRTKPLSEIGRHVMPLISHVSAVEDERDAMLYALVGMNHMGGDDRGGYCICPLHDGSAPDEKHATSCADARIAIRKAGAAA
jgi:hypothetical protein